MLDRPLHDVSVVLVPYDSVTIRSNKKQNKKEHRNRNMSSENKDKSVQEKNNRVDDKFRPIFRKFKRKTHGGKRLSQRQRKRQDAKDAEADAVILRDVLTFHDIKSNTQYNQSRIICVETKSELPNPNTRIYRIRDVPGTFFLSVPGSWTCIQLFSYLIAPHSHSLFTICASLMLLLPTHTHTNTHRSILLCECPHS
jgi:hypothetical protein